MIVISSILSFNSCSDELDLTPISSKSISGFYKTQNDFEQAITGVYASLRSTILTSNYSYYLTECKSDNCWQGVEYDDGLISRFSDNAGTPILNTAWSNLYNAILRCNYIITKIPDGDFTSEDVRNKIEGEARFARAIFYFDLVRFFRGVPIVEKPLTIGDSYKLTRNSEEEVYNFITSELEKAATLLPNIKPSLNKNRATSYAAYGYLGKVYAYESGYPLNKNNWALAKSALEKVINGIGMNGFFDSYESIFLQTNENKEQSIFSIGCTASTSGYGNPYPTRHAPNAMKVGTGDGEIPYGGSPYQLFLNDEIINSIFPENGDLRKDYSVQFKWKDKSNEWVTNMPFDKKYRNGAVNSSYNWEVDYIALRFTDVYMLYGEACYHTGDKATALTVLNKVRNRAGLPSLTANDISNEADYTTINLKERRAEFCFENQRWGDLVRTDRAYDVMKNFLKGYGFDGNLTSKDQYFYPIPQQETNVSGLE